MLLPAEDKKLILIHALSFLHPGVYLGHVVSMKDGSVHPILELKHVSIHVLVRHFHMESLRSVIASSFAGHSLQFQFVALPFSLVVLPFSLVVASRCSPRCSLAILLCTRRMTVVSHLDDLLIKGPPRQENVSSLQIVLDTLSHFGGVVNFPNHLCILPKGSFSWACYSTVLQQEFFYPMKTVNAKTESQESSEGLSNLRFYMQVLLTMVVSIKVLMAYIKNKGILAHQLWAAIM